MADTVMPDVLADSAWVQGIFDHLGERASYPDRAAAELRALFERHASSDIEVELSRYLQGLAERVSRGEVLAIDAVSDILIVAGEWRKQSPDLRYLLILGDD